MICYLVFFRLMIYYWIFVLNSCPKPIFYLRSVVCTFLFIAFFSRRSCPLSHAAVTKHIAPEWCETLSSLIAPCPLTPLPKPWEDPR